MTDIRCGHTPRQDGWLPASARRLDVMEVQLPLGKGRRCQAEIQGGLSHHTRPPAGFELFLFASPLSSYEDRFPSWIETYGRFVRRSRDSDKQVH